MQTIEHLRELYIYNDWANRRIVAALKLNRRRKSARDSGASAHYRKRLFERLYGKDFDGFRFLATLSTEDCGRLAQENAEITSAF
jgi:hypothetical protein